MCSAMGGASESSASMASGSGRGLAAIPRGVIQKGSKTPSTSDIGIQVVERILGTRNGWACRHRVSRGCLCDALSPQGLSVVLVESAQGTDGPQELRHEIVVAAAHTGREGRREGGREGGR